MAELSEADDSRLRSLGRVAAQYFRERIDAAAPGFDVGQPRAADRGDRETLVRQCSRIRQPGGRDFKAVGDALAPSGGPAI